MKERKERRRRRHWIRLDQETPFYSFPRPPLSIMPEAPTSRDQREG